jgi:hypothetical protein
MERRIIWNQYITKIPFVSKDFNTFLGRRWKVMELEEAITKDALGGQDI